MFLRRNLFILVLVCILGVCQGKNGTSFTVGTVLFTMADLNHDCWSQDNIAVLTSRMLMSNLMPSVEKLKADDDNFVFDIIEYFRLLLEVIRMNTTGKTKHIMLMAATDTMGGYMRHLVIPITKYAFYAGNIQYSSIIRLYQLYDELKNFLRTNGEGWAKPWRNAGKHLQAKVLNVAAPAPSSDPCRGIIYYKHSPPSNHPPPPPKEGEKPTCGMEVPLPFFDSKTHPAAIAVPFKTFGLRNLESRVSAYILVKYYVAVSKCMAARNTNEEDTNRFNQNIFQFIASKVMPHLGDEHFYAAFGGVLRVLQTVSELAKVKGHTLTHINIMPEILDREPSDFAEDEEMATADQGGGKTSNDKRSRNNLILLAALATIIIWFCLGAAFVCCRIKAGKMRGDKAVEDDETDENACRETNCPALYEPASTATTDNETQETNTKVLYSVNNQQQHKLSAKAVVSKLSKKSSKTTKSSKSSQSRTTEMDSDSRSRSQGTHSVPSQSAHTTTTAVKTQDTTTLPATAPTVQSAATAHGGDSSSRSTKPPQLQVQSIQYYPPTFACHTSMTGKVKIDSSTDEYTSREEPNTRPYVFGYDFQTTSEEESSPRDQTTDGENDLGGNMSK